MLFGLNYRTGRSYLTSNGAVLTIHDTYRYGCNSSHFPRPMNLNGSDEPQWSCYQRSFNLYYLLPPGNHTDGGFTPQLFVYDDCNVKSLRGMIIKSLPPISTSYSIEFFSCTPSIRPKGWSVTSSAGASPALLEKRAAQSISCCHGDSIIVSIKAPHWFGGSMTLVDPFQASASPPRVLAWMPSCG
jgi:hypothetical protein